MGRRVIPDWCDWRTIHGSWILPILVTILISLGLAGVSMVPGLGG